ncbi:hypothetical protein E0D97_08525 [Oricola cellulosilytica]|uniref:Uncharacterized protein n=1 Tax=Oricola cellulosilytica TaxID=1429082 RepID=A0A4R0PCU7_9HYPH|nr:hypothetical protein E0D97_08525 [Oricola cellulosilytica]
MKGKFNAKPLTDQEEANIQKQIADDPDTWEASDEELARAKPFAEVFPDLAESIRRSRGGGAASSCSSLPAYGAVGQGRRGWGSGAACSTFFFRQHQPHRCYRQEHAQRIGGEGLEAEALIDRLAAGDFFRIAAIQHVELDEGDADPAGRRLDAPERVGEEIRAETAAAKPPVAPDHRDIGGGNRAVPGSVSRVSRRNIAIIDRVGVQRIKADQIAARRHHDIKAYIAGLRQLVGGTAAFEAESGQQDFTLDAPTVTALALDTPGAALDFSVAQISRAAGAGISARRTVILP